MIPVMCIVQEGQVSTESEFALKAQISGFTQRAFGSQADIDWVVVPTGSGFTAAKPSSTVIASLHANRTLEQEESIALLRELESICMEKTGRTAREVVISIRDSQ